MTSCVVKKSDDLRRARRDLHRLFYRLMTLMVFNGECSTLTARGKAYVWIADFLGVPRKGCRISSFTFEQCRKAIVACEDKIARHYKKETP